MPTIDLTDEQAEELRDAISYELDRLEQDIADAVRLGGDDDPGAIGYRHSRDLLKEVLSILEDA